ncbi:MAG: hypothetical protein AAF907_04200 [Planctomycetota bacterium]
MSRPDSSPEPGVYDVLLFCAVSALLCGIIFLVLHLSSYNWEIAPGF